MDTEKRGQSAVKINNNIKPIIIEDTDSIKYDNTINTGVMDDMTLNKLIKDISKLDKTAHECIYQMLRGTKPTSFFATNGLGTHFNINTLSDKTKWELYRLTKMSVLDTERKDQIKVADATHEKIICDLSTILNTKPVLPPEPIIPNQKTEEEKTRDMICMNNNPLPKMPDIPVMPVVKKLIVKPKKPVL